MFQQVNFVSLRAKLDMVMSNKTISIFKRKWSFRVVEVLTSNHRRRWFQFNIYFIEQRVHSVMRIFSVLPPCGFGTQGAGLHFMSESVLWALPALLGLLLLLIHSKEGKPLSGNYGNGRLGENFKKSWQITCHYCRLQKDVLIKETCRTCYSPAPASPQLN